MTTTGALNQESIPQGIICMWAGEAKDIPTIWALCDGKSYKSYKTPDLRQSFIIGAGSGEGYDKVNTHGEASKINIMSAGAHGHYIPHQTDHACITFSGCGKVVPSDNTSNVSDHSHNLKIVNDKGDASELRPKWYALCYIIYLGFPRE